MSRGHAMRGIRRRGDGCAPGVGRRRRSCAGAPARRRTRHHATQRGVGLVEVMVALLILAFGLLGIARLQAVLRVHADAAAQRAAAMRLAQAEIESMRAAPGEPAVAGAAQADTTGDADPAVGYTLERRLVPIAGGRADALSIVVRWRDRAGQPQQAVLSTIITRADPALGAALRGWRQ